MSTRVTLGRVAGVHGVRGWVKVVSYTRPVTNLLDYPAWWIAKGDGFEAKLIEGQAQGPGLMVHFTGAGGEPITDRDVAATLVGSEIQVDRKDLPKPKKGEYYWIDLVGVEVANEQGVALGRIRDMTSNGAHDVMVVRDGEVERLIPFVHGAIVKSVDMKARRVVCDWQPDY
jgi:16S rRNA processing protein RimM